MHRWCCGEWIWRAESSAASCPVFLSLHLENAGPGSSAPVEFPLSDCDPERFANRFTSVCARWLNGLWQESEAARLQANLLGEPANIQQCFFLLLFVELGQNSFADFKQRQSRHRRAPGSHNWSLTGVALFAFIFMTAVLRDFGAWTTATAAARRRLGVCRLRRGVLAQAQPPLSGPAGSVMSWDQTHGRRDREPLKLYPRSEILNTRRLCSRMPCKAEWCWIDKKWTDWPFCLYSFSK